ncbi:hypothetical protein K431DRAFT_304173 [Polychaeton citri CBS 116435]|uniref:Uncharacterized protein n=1 Tax=Polychaeton citri CBS 116435 TaxID=1314669 RepID=A0A9P4Q971_9PEZI|nr:hypothetical protein K431DRAFT_304173 [Polychaeton citri CBS 116435]
MRLPTVLKTTLPTTLLLLLLPCLTHADRGKISEPAANSTILPSQPFNYTYEPRSDYCLSSYNTTVWLLTSPPQSIIDNAAVGKFLLRCGYDSYANPYPANPCPSQLVTPDLSKGSGGFGTGEVVDGSEGRKVWLWVVEEFNQCGDTLGNQFAWTYTPLCYNCTSSSL